MVRTSVIAVVVACSFAWTGCTTERAMSYRRDMARGENDSLAVTVKRDVVEMKRAGIGDDVIINLLHASNSFFPMYARDVVELADSGVSDSVINAMILGPQTGSWGRVSRSFAYYSPSYWDWGYPYWYPWDPYYSLAFSGGYYRPYYGYRAYAPYSHFRSRGAMSTSHGFGRGTTGGRRR